MVVDEHGQISCECGNVIGTLEERGEVVLLIGGLEAYSVHGQCRKCRRPYHYTSGGKLTRILARKSGKSLTETEAGLLKSGEKDV